MKHNTYNWTSASAYKYGKLIHEHATMNKTEYVQLNELNMNGEITPPLTHI